MDEEYKRLERKHIAKGKIIDYFVDTMRLPDGRRKPWDFINHHGAAAIVPVLGNGDIIMVRQYRNAIERYNLEIPAGGLNADEDRAAAAARELEEETGFRSDRVEHLLDLYTTVAYSNEMIGIYYTNDLKPGKQHLDDDEYLNVETHPLDELVKMILDGKIQDAKP